MIPQTPSLNPPSPSQILTLSPCHGKHTATQLSLDRLCEIPPSAGPQLTAFDAADGEIVNIHAAVVLPLAGGEVLEKAIVPYGVVVVTDEIPGAEFVAEVVNVGCDG